MAYIIPNPFTKRIAVVGDLNIMRANSAMRASVNTPLPDNVAHGHLRVMFEDVDDGLTIQTFNSGGGPPMIRANALCLPMNANGFPQFGRFPAAMLHAWSAGGMGWGPGWCHNWWDDGTYVSCMRLYYGLRGYTGGWCIDPLLPGAGAGGVHGANGLMIAIGSPMTEAQRPTPSYSRHVGEYIDPVAFAMGQYDMSLRLNQMLVNDQIDGGGGRLSRSADGVVAGHLLMEKIEHEEDFYNETWIAVNFTRGFYEPPMIGVLFDDGANWNFRTPQWWLTQIRALTNTGCQFRLLNLTGNPVGSTMFHVLACGV